jgi:hypothetical protein
MLWEKDGFEKKKFHLQLKILYYIFRFVFTYYKQKQIFEIFEKKNFKILVFPIGGIYLTRMGVMTGLALSLWDFVTA